TPSCGQRWRNRWGGPRAGYSPTTRHRVFFDRRMARIKKRARAILATIFRNHAHHAGMGAWRALRELSVSFAGADVRVLCYHSVRSRTRFAVQMDTLAEQGYTVISLPELTGWLSGAVPCPAAAVLLTFDGGYGDQLENAAPVLDGLKSPAVVSAVRRAGFSVAFTIDLGGVDRRDDPYQRNRIAVLGEPSPAEFSSYLAGTRLVSGALLGWWKIRERRIG